MACQGDFLKAYLVFSQGKDSLYFVCTKGIVALPNFRHLIWCCALPLRDAYLSLLTVEGADSPDCRSTRPKFQKWVM